MSDSQSVTMQCATAAATVSRVEQELEHSILFMPQTADCNSHDESAATPADWQ